jgi:hypothetical protein
MKEFASRIDIDLTKQIKQDEKDIVVQDRLANKIREYSEPKAARNEPGYMLGVREDNDFYNPLGTGDEYMGPDSRLPR